jgi:hypothetical protein
MDAECEAKPEAEPQQPQMLDFPDHIQCKGQAFSQFNNKTGWLWVGIHLPSFNFRTAFAIFRSQEMTLALQYDKIDNERMIRASLATGANGKGPKSGFIRGFMDKLRQGH